MNEISTAKDWLRKRALADGDHCPVCNRFTKIYKRKITSSMAIFLIKFWNKYRDHKFHSVTAFRKDFFCGDYGKLAYWGLTESDGSVGDVSKSSGRWRVTPSGELFARNRLEVPQFCYVYDNKVLGVDGDPVSITECLASRYNYEEIFTA